MPKPGGLESARASLEAIAADLVRSAGREEAPALLWPLVCGAAVGARTRVLGHADGILRVEVPDVTWRAQLAAFATQYVQTLARMLPSARIVRVEFVVHGR
jgi:hypothetical protein